VICKHDRILRDLETRLLESGKYDIVQSNIEYCRNGYVGEVDVLTYRKDNNTWYFWEVKSSYCRKSKTKAKEQYQRYCAAHPKKKIRGIYVTPTKLLRLG